MLSGGELLLIVFVALMLFGAEKIPEIARTLGKGVREFKKATDDIKKEILDEGSLESLQNLKNTTNDIKSNLQKVITNTTDKLTDLPKSDKT